jgi:stage II sporulation protein AA (anti-sigma F factor antagonist)
MEMTVEELPEGVTLVALDGRMDLQAAQAVDMRFSVLAGSKRKLVVDVTDLEFIASMGLRTLLICARTIKGKGGKMAIAGAQPNVLQVLDTSGIGEVVSVSPSIESALAAVSD